jgi:hypothetical protein
VAGAGWRRHFVGRTVLCVAALSAFALASPVAPSGAQGLFDFFWGNRGNDSWNDRRDGRWNERAFDRWNDRGSDRWNERWNERGNDQQIQRHAPGADKRQSARPDTREDSRTTSRGPSSPREDRDPAPVATSGASVSYCVRLCDGRYFPIQRQSGVEPEQICNAFCPAAKTKIYSGDAIEHAVANDGKRYSKLDTAFVYRQKAVDGCSCNGKDSFGLARLDVTKDPTLRAGDIVARDGTLMAFKGSKKPTYTAGDFTPIQTYAKGDSSLRKRLSGVKVAPPLTANLSAGQDMANASAPAQASQPPDGKRRNQPSR